MKGDWNVLFPLFTDLSGKRAVIVGGGTIGLRRAEILVRFGADVTVISPEIKRTKQNVNHIDRVYEKGDLKGAFLAVAATDDREVNCAVGIEAGELGIPVSVADCAGECTFYFPAICEGDGLVAGVVSDGSDHRKTAKAAGEIREILSKLPTED